MGERCYMPIDVSYRAVLEESTCRALLKGFGKNKQISELSAIQLGRRYCRFTIVYIIYNIDDQ